MVGLTPSLERMRSQNQCTRETMSRTFTEMILKGGGIWPREISKRVKWRGDDEYVNGPEQASSKPKGEAEETRLRNQGETSHHGGEHRGGSGRRKKLRGGPRTGDGEEAASERSSRWE